MIEKIFPIKQMKDKIEAGDKVQVISYDDFEYEFGSILTIDTGTIGGNSHYDIIEKKSVIYKDYVKLISKKTMNKEEAIEKLEKLTKVIELTKNIAETMESEVTRIGEVLGK